jgi:hypothetical protein
MPLRDTLIFVLGEVFARDGVLTIERVKWMLGTARSYVQAGAMQLLHQAGLGADMHTGDMDMDLDDFDDAFDHNGLDQAGGFGDDGMVPPEAFKLKPTSLDEYERPAAVAQRKRVLSKTVVTAAELLAALPQTADVESQSDEFQKFAEAVFFSREGKVYWRCVSELFTPIVINDYDPETGRLQHGAFAQLTVFAEGQISCTCAAFNEVSTIFSVVSMINIPNRMYFRI